MLPLVMPPVELERDDTAVVVSFRDHDGSELRFVQRGHDPAVLPELQRTVPHRFTDKFMGGTHGYSTREDTPLPWLQAAWLLRCLAMMAEPIVARRLDALAAMADAQLPEGVPRRPSLRELLQSTSDVLFPADMGERRVELDSRDSDGDTPLHVLLWRRDVQGARELIAAGADTTAAGDMDDTPLHVALRLELADAVAMLLAAGADPDAHNCFGDTPRAMAYKRGGAVADCFRTAGLDPPLPSPPPVDAPE
jgi:hypothetical protein